MYQKRIMRKGLLTILLTTVLLLSAIMVPTAQAQTVEARKRAKEASLKLDLASVG